MGNTWGNSGNSVSAKSLQMVMAAMKLKTLLLGSQVKTNLDSILKSRDCKRDTDVQKSLLDSVGEGEGGMI